MNNKNQIGGAQTTAIVNRDQIYNPTMTRLQKLHQIYEDKLPVSYLKHIRQFYFKIIPNLPENILFDENVETYIEKLNKFKRMYIEIQSYMQDIIMYITEIINNIEQITNINTKVIKDALQALYENALDYKTIIDNAISSNINLFVRAYELYNSSLTNRYNTRYNTLEQNEAFILSDLEYLKNQIIIYNENITIPIYINAKKYISSNKHYFTCFKTFITDNNKSLETYEDYIKDITNINIKYLTIYVNNLNIDEVITYSQPEYNKREFERVYPAIMAITKSINDNTDKLDSVIIKRLLDTFNNYKTNFNGNGMSVFIYYEKAYLQLLNELKEKTSKLNDNIKTFYESIFNNGVIDWNAIDSYQQDYQQDYEDIIIRANSLMNGYKRLVETSIKFTNT